MGDVDRSSSDSAEHVPVLVDEVLRLLDPQPGETVLDVTVGRGGHCAAIIERIAPGGRYIGLDVDPGNLAHVEARLPDPPGAMNLVCSNFGDADVVLEDLGVAGVDLLLADLGFASPQLADPSRGLSFSREGPLDMRLDPSAQTTAADLLARLGERELADLIFRYGEERFSRRIARKIVERRRNEPIRTTRELADLCAAAYGSRARRQRIDPATRTFQALRIAVNDELGRLSALLEMLPGLIRPAGRVVMISFHSLEDRLVKRSFRSMEQQERGERLTKKPITAEASERDANVRSRSAKLRAFRFAPA